MSNLTTDNIQAYIIKSTRIFVIIAVLTFLQIAWAVFFSDDFSTSLNGIVYFLLLSGKVYYMLLEFMHLKHEKKFFNIALFSPAAIMLVWFVVSFCYEGGAGLQSQKDLGYRRPDNFPAKEIKYHQTEKAIKH